MLFRSRARAACTARAYRQAMRRPRRSPRWLHHTYFSLHFPNKKAKATTPQCFALRQRLTLTLISKQTYIFTFIILNIAQLLSDCKGFLLSRIAKRAAKIFTCRFRASARMKSVCLQTQKNRGHAPRFFYSEREKSFCTGTFLRPCSAKSEHILSAKRQLCDSI